MDETKAERLLAQLGVASIEEALALVKGSTLPPQLDRWLAFEDLRTAGIVDNWQTLRSWQKNPRINFPPGRLFGPNTRRWSLKNEIEPWLASRPVARDTAA